MVFEKPAGLIDQVSAEFVWFCFGLRWNFPSHGLAQRILLEYFIRPLAQFADISLSEINQANFNNFNIGQKLIFKLSKNIITKSNHEFKIFL